MKIQPNDIIENVSNYYQPELEKLYTRSRITEVRKVRQISMYFMCELCFTNPTTPMHWQRIGNYFNRDHSTAIHSYKVVMNDFETDPVFRHEINEIRAVLLNLQKNNKGVPINYFLMGVFGKELHQCL